MGIVCAPNAHYDTRAAAAQRPLVEAGRVKARITLLKHVSLLRVDVTRLVRTDREEPIIKQRSAVQEEVTV